MTPIIDYHELLAALKPFAREGARWLGTNPAHDDLTVVIDETGYVARKTEITIGDLKRAGALWSVVERCGA